MIGNDYFQIRSELGGSLSELSALAADLKAAPETLETLRQLQHSLSEPFLFVVVGEVKAGKSSLLNALLGHEFCKVDVLPATDRIYVFKYAEQERNVAVSPRLTECYRAENCLRDFSVVDTPGTNTIVAEHQTITEQFLPLADLVFFVFSAANPWAASAWEFLKLISKKWLKRVVFIVQQADLRSPAEIASILQHLEQTILERLGQACPVFAVSARLALEARLSGDAALAAQSGFDRLETYINDEVATGEVRLGKLRSVCSTTRVVLRDLGEKTNAAMGVVERDAERIEQVQGVLESRKEQSLRQMGGVLYTLSQSYEKAQRRGEELLAQRLTLFQTARLILNKGQWRHGFQQELESQLRDSIQRQIENALELVEADLRSLWQQLHEELQRHFSGETRAALSLPDFARQREELLRRLELTLLEHGTGEKVDQQLGKLFEETAQWLRVPAGVAAAGGLATLVAVLAHVAVVDVTGSIAGAAALLGTVVAVFKRQQILAEFRRQMHEKRETVLAGISDHLRHSLERFYQDLAGTFQPLKTFCETQRRLYAPMISRLDQIETALARSSVELEEVSRRSPDAP
jgi:tRNA U34 5-carboxymethylaminomethyl modifying GTPase MnmE/TrmE